MLLLFNYVTYVNNVPRQIKCNDTKEYKIKINIFSVEINSCPKSWNTNIRKSIMKHNTKLPTYFLPDLDNDTGYCKGIGQSGGAVEYTDCISAEG